MKCDVFNLLDITIKSSNQFFMLLSISYHPTIEYLFQERTHLHHISLWMFFDVQNNLTYLDQEVKFQISAHVPEFIHIHRNGT